MSDEPTAEEMARYLSEQIDWLRYVQAWLDGHKAAGGEYRSDLVQRAWADYGRAAESRRTEGGQ